MKAETFRISQQRVAELPPPQDPFMHPGERFPNFAYDPDATLDLGELHPPKTPVAYGRGVYGSPHSELPQPRHAADTAWAQSGRKTLPTIYIGKHHWR